MLKNAYIDIKIRSFLYGVFSNAKENTIGSIPFKEATSGFYYQFNFNCIKYNHTEK